MWDISLLFVQWRIYLVVRLKAVRLSLPCVALLSWFCYYLCWWIKCGIELSAHSTSVTLTQTVRRIIGATQQPKNAHGPLDETGQAVWSHFFFFFWWSIIWDPYNGGNCAWVVHIPKMSRIQLIHDKGFGLLSPHGQGSALPGCKSSLVWEYHWHSCQITYRQIGCG